MTISIHGVTINNTKLSAASGAAPTVNYSNLFDGVGDYLSIPNATALNMETSDFTAEFWARPISVPVVAGTLLAKRATISEYGYFNVGFGASLTPILLVSTTGSSWGINTTSSINFTVNTWSHLALTRSGNTWRLFVNGVIGATASLSGSITTTAPFIIGASANDGQYAFPGYISNVRLVKGTALYTSNFSVPTSPLTSDPETSLLTCQSATFIDNSGNNFTVNKVGDVAISTVNPFN